MSDTTHHTQYAEAAGHHVPQSSKKEIWKVFWILFALTALEFFIAFTLPKAYQDFKVAIFLLLTVAKAYYIVAFFMHLKAEKLTLAYTIILPLIFIVYLVVLLFMEGLG